MPARLEINPGDRFGRLVVIRQVGKGHGPVYLCQCDCGSTVERKGYHLNAGVSRSCGCYKSDQKRGFVSLEMSAYIQFFQQYDQNARRRHLLMDLELDDFISLIVQPCHYCQAEPKERVWRESSKDNARKATVFCNGIDRVDNQLGYSKDNCVPCCTTCNWMKTDMGYDQFIDQCIKIGISNQRSYMRITK